MRGKDQKRQVFSIGSMLFAALFASAPAQADFLPVYGSPTYNILTDNGYYNPFYSIGPGTSAGGAIGGGNAYKTSGHYPKGVEGKRALRWGTSIAATELDGLGVDALGFPNTSVLGINYDGTAVGSASRFDAAHNPLGERAVRWDASSTAAIELDPLMPSNAYAESRAYAINKSGTIVGDALKSFVNAPNYRAVRWNAGGTVATELGALETDASGNTQSRAWAINDAGTAVGTARKFNTLVRAVRWDASGTAATELEVLPGGTSTNTESYPLAINNTGTTVGWSTKYNGTTSMGRRAVRWSGTGTAISELGNLGLSDTDNDRLEAFAINDLGTAVGYGDKFVSGVYKGSRAIRWDASGTAATELGVLGTSPAGFAMGEAYAINQFGTAVGFVEDYGASGSTGSRATMWVDTAAIDLNTLIDPSSGWFLTEAVDITSDGWITGIGNFNPDGGDPRNGYARMFLIQVPEPSSIALLAFMLSLKRPRRLREM